MVFAFISNPSKTDFVEYIAHQQIDKTDNILGKSIVNAIKKYADDFIKDQKNEMADLVVQKDYFLFSKFVIDLPIIDEEVSYIGIFNRFIKLPTNK